MIRLRLLILTLLLFGSLPGIASAVSIERHSGPYLGFSAGLTKLDKIKADDNLGSYNLKSDDGTAFGLSMGYDLPAEASFGKGRVELEYQQWKNDFSQAEYTDGTFSAGGSLKGNRLLLNSFATIPNKSKFVPYVGLGLGVAKIKLDSLVVDGSPLINDDDLVFAGQLGCGIQLDMHPHVRIDLGYRYFISTDPEFTDVDGQKVKLNLDTQSLLFSVAYLF